MWVLYSFKTKQIAVNDYAVEASIQLHTIIIKLDV